MYHTSGLSDPFCSCAVLYLVVPGGQEHAFGNTVPFGSFQRRSRVSGWSGLAAEMRFATPALLVYPPALRIPAFATGSGSPAQTVYTG